MITFIRLLSFYVVVLGMGTASGEIMYFEVLEDDICVEYEGERPAYGLCNAYCNALDCAAEELNGKGKSNACDRIKKNFQRFTGEELLPCEEVSPPPENCPCFGAGDLTSPDDGNQPVSCIPTPNFISITYNDFDFAYSGSTQPGSVPPTCAYVDNENDPLVNIGPIDLGPEEDVVCQAVIEQTCIDSGLLNADGTPATIIDWSIIERTEEFLKENRYRW